MTTPTTPISIAQALAFPVGQTVRLSALLAQVTPGTTSAGKPWLATRVHDRSGSVSMPIWDNVESLQERLLPGRIYDLTVKVEEYKGERQFRMVSWTLRPDLKTEDYLPAYELTTDDVDALQSLVDGLSEPWRALAKAAVAGVWTALYDCPASVGHHSNRIHGLFLHTLGVLRVAATIAEMYSIPTEDRDRLVFLALMHDLMKTREYDWATGIAQKPGILSNHRDMGTSYLERINEQCGSPLDEKTLQECMYSILSHHGQYGEYEPKSAFDSLLHCCDNIDAQAVKTWGKHTRNVLPVIE